MTDNKQEQEQASPDNFLSLIFTKLKHMFPPVGHEDNTKRTEPDVVKIADVPKPLAPPPLTLQVEEPNPSHPLLVLPVYALGGFIFLNWVWARWKERKERAKKKKGSSSDDASPADNDDN